MAALLLRLAARRLHCRGVHGFPEVELKTEKIRQVVQPLQIVYDRHKEFPEVELKTEKIRRVVQPLQIVYDRHKEDVLLARTFDFDLDCWWFDSQILETDRLLHSELLTRYVAHVILDDIYSELQEKKGCIRHASPFPKGHGRYSMSLEERRDPLVLESLIKFGSVTAFERGICLVKERGGTGDLQVVVDGNFEADNDNSRLFERWSPTGFRLYAVPKGMVYVVGPLDSVWEPEKICGPTIKMCVEVDLTAVGQGVIAFFVEPADVKKPGNIFVKLNRLGVNTNGMKMVGHHIEDSHYKLFPLEEYVPWERPHRTATTVS